MSAQSKRLKILAIAAVVGCLGLIIAVNTQVWRWWYFPPVIVEDCTWSGKARTWLDENGNGIIDPGEKPLREVALTVESLGYKFGDTTTAASDWNGEASLGLTHTDCHNAYVEVSAQVPDGYRLTTPARVRAGTSNEGPVLEFGFNYLPAAPTVTARPPGPECGRYLYPSGAGFTDLAVSPNGTVWALATNILRFDPVSSRWTDPSLQASPPCCEASSVTVESDDSVWFASGEDALYFDGKVWRSKAPPASIAKNHVNRIAIDGPRVWFATDLGAFMLDRDTSKWRGFTTKDGLIDDTIDSVGIGPDGSIWLATSSGTSHAAWPSRPLGNPVWENFENAGTHGITRIVARPDNTVWFEGWSTPIYYDLASREWKLLDVPRSGVEINGLGPFAFAADSTLWVGSTSSNTIYHVLGEPAASDRNWRSYDSRDGVPAEMGGDDRIVRIAIGPDEAVWVATTHQVARCYFPE